MGVFIVDSGAFLHMMSENELTSVGKDAIRRSHQPTVNTTANGNAESAEEATGHLNDVDVFVTVMLAEDSPGVLSLCEEMGHSFEWKRRESPSQIERM